MQKKEKSFFTINFLLLIIGCNLLLFASVYIFTRNTIWDSLDLTNTGQIGDTIGGITAPIINLIGAILVYVSFKAQIKANKIQFDILNTDLQNQKQTSNFNVTLELFKELKEDYKNLTYKENNGQLALTVYVNQIKDDWKKEDFIAHMKKAIYFDWKFILSEYDLILTHIDTAEFKNDEKNKIYHLVLNYYINLLEYSVVNIKEALIKFEIDDDVLRTINSLDNKKTITRL